MTKKYTISPEFKKIMQAVPSTLIRDLNLLKKEKCFYVYRDENGEYYDLNIARSYACAGIAFQGCQLVKITKISEVAEVYKLPIVKNANGEVFLRLFFD